MSFDTGQLFIAAYSNGSNHAFAAQSNPARVSYTGGKTIAWVLSSGAINGTPFPTPFLASVFSFTPDAVGSPDGSVNVNLQNLVAVAPIFAAFLNGGTVTLNVTTDSTDEPLTVNLRALKTTDFVLHGTGASPNVASHANRPGVVGGANNIGFAGEAATDYAVQVASAFDPVTLNPLAGYQINAALTAAGALTLNATGTPPLDAAQFVKLTRGGKSSILPVNVYTPTDLIVMLDRSGSMDASVGPGSSKWSVATSIANLFSTLVGNLVPERNVVGGTAATIAQHNRTAFGRFHWSGGTEVVPIETFALSDTTPAVPADAPAGGTPIGMALEDAATRFVSPPAADPLSAPAKWRRRHVVLLTDGMDNTGTPRLNVLNDAQFPSLSSDSTTGVVLHNISYARTGDVQVPALAALVGSHDGAFDSTETNPADALAPEALREAFLSMLPNILPAALGGPVTAGSPQLVEDGVDRLILVATQDGGTLGATRNGVAVPGGEIVTGNGDGYSWAILNDPAPGNYAATGAPAGSQVYALFDLSLRSRFSVEAEALGAAIKLAATLNFLGEPIRGAEVRVTQRSPGESLGEMLTTFARNGGLSRAIRKKLLDPRALQAALAAAGGQAQGTVDHPAVRRLLLDAAEKTRGLEFQKQGNVHLLTEVSPGRYEASIDASNTQNEDVYSFIFHAEGTTPQLHPFSRDQRISKVLLAAPDPERSETSLHNAAPTGAAPNWIASVVPRNTVGKPLGPGLIPLLQFQYLDAADRKKLPPLDTIDNLDGTYSARLQTAADKLPKFGLFWQVPGAAENPIVVREKHPRLKKVRVTLDKIQILDDKDPLCLGAGELVFTATVSPNGTKSRAVQTRLPSKGRFKANSGETVEVNTEIFSGYVEENASLAISIAGKELDWPHWLDRDDPLTRYTRTLPLPKSNVSLSPNDERHDPESLRDWRLWYSVKVG